MENLWNQKSGLSQGLCSAVGEGEKKIPLKQPPTNNKMFQKIFHKKNHPCPNTVYEVYNFALVQDATHPRPHTSI